MGPMSFSFLNSRVLFYKFFFFFFFFFQFYGASSDGLSRFKAGLAMPVIQNVVSIKKKKKKKKKKKNEKICWEYHAGSIP
jgi:hypothetical protein